MTCPGVGRSAQVVAYWDGRRASGKVGRCGMCGTMFRIRSVEHPGRVPDHDEEDGIESG